MVDSLYINSHQGDPFKAKSSHSSAQNPLWEGWMSISLRAKAKDSANCPMICHLSMPAFSCLHLCPDYHTQVHWLLCLSSQGYCTRYAFCYECFPRFAHLFILFLSLLKCHLRLSLIPL